MLVFVFTVLHKEIVKAQGIIIPAGASVIVNNGNLGIGQNLQNDGTLTNNGGAIVCNGTTQSITGSNPVAFNNLIVNSGSATTVNTTGQTVKGYILSNGSLNANDKITLLSDAGQTAYVDGSGTGSVTGNLTMQRYLSSSFGYKYLSAPFQSATVNELADELNLAATFPPLYKYDEALTSTGWSFYTNSSSPLSPFHGYAANFGTTSTPSVVDMTGVVSNGTVSLPALYNNDNVYTQGFNLIGNPYPSPIDWDAASGWSKTNIDDAVYYFNASTTDQYTGTYSSYVNGVSSDGIASNVIPAMQGFFVHVSDGSYPVSGSLSINNAARVNVLNPAFHKRTTASYPFIRLRAKFSSGTKLSDPAVVYFIEDAKDIYEEHIDALKMLNTDTKVPNLYTLAKGNEKLSIYALQQPSDSLTVIPLGIETEKDDFITFAANEINNMPEGLHIYIADMQSKKVHTLYGGNEYQTLVPKGKDVKRFSIVFSKKELKDDVFVAPELIAYTLHGRLFVNLSIFTGDDGQLAIHNSSGQTINTLKLTGFGQHEIPASFMDGIYLITFYSDKGKFSKKLFIGND